MGKVFHICIYTHCIIQTLSHLQHNHIYTVINYVKLLHSQVRVTQGQEPPHLMSLFKGKPMIIHKGGTSRKGGQSKTSSTRLFHIRQSTSRATRAVEVSCRHTWHGVGISDFLLLPVCMHPCLQVDASASKLNTNDGFVLKTPNAVFVWKGLGASDEEMEAAKQVVSVLGGSASNVSEGKEPGKEPNKILNCWM